MVETMITERGKQHKEKMNLLKDLVSGDNCKETPQTTDPVDLFFQSIAQTVKKFAPKRISEAKSKIMSLVSEMEMQNIDEMQNNISYVDEMNYDEMNYDEIQNTAE